MLSRTFSATYHCVVSEKHIQYAFRSSPCGIISDMQPENSRSATSGAEHLPMPPSVGPEAVPQLPRMQSPEAAPLSGGERFEQVAEAGARASDMAAQAAPVAAAPSAPPPQSPPSNLQKVSSAAPLVAADEDLIEKEWVDKAKEIIGQTAGDPYTRSQQVSELQRDYLQKRYGKVIGASE